MTQLIYGNIQEDIFAKILMPFWVNFQKYFRFHMTAKKWVK